LQATSKFNHVRVTLEYLVIVKRTAWRCQRPCSRIVRHRDEQRGLLPAICPSCGGAMKLFDTYWIPRVEVHNCILGQGEVCEERGV
jgi:hypothetical protein